MASSGWLYKTLGVEGITSLDKGLILIYLVTFVPLIYKLFAPFFILVGLPSLTQYVNISLIIIGFIFASREIWKYLRIGDIAFYMLVSFFIVISPVFYPQTERFVEENVWHFVFQVFPFFFVGITLDYPKRRAILPFVGKVGIIVQLFWQLCKLLGLVEVETTDTDGSLGEQMELAYDLLFPIFFVYLEAMKTFKIGDVFFLIIGIMLLFFMGTRGPIIVFAIFIAGYFLFFNHYESHPVLIRFIVISLFAILYVFLNTILEFLIPIAANLGFSTRVFDSILLGQMADMESASNRDIFYDAVIKAIKEDSVGLGYGWGGDRLHTPTGGYAHNLELELLCQFGYFGGGLLLLILTVLTFRCLFLSKKNKTESFWFSVLCGGVLSLQLSDTYVTNPLFFVFIGYVVMTVRQRLYSVI